MCGIRRIFRPSIRNAPMTLPRLYDIKEAARYLGVASSTLRY